jgi:hypothetical protein
MPNFGGKTGNWEREVKVQSLRSVVKSFGFHVYVEKYLRDYLLLKVTSAPWN